MGGDDRVVEYDTGNWHVVSTHKSQVDLEFYGETVTYMQGQLVIGAPLWGNGTFRELGRVYLSNGTTIEGEHLQGRFGGFLHPDGYVGSPFANQFVRILP